LAPSSSSHPLTVIRPSIASAVASGREHRDCADGGHADGGGERGGGERGGGERDDDERSDDERSDDERGDDERGGGEGGGGRCGPRMPIEWRTCPLHHLVCPPPPAFLRRAPAQEPSGRASESRFIA